MYVTGGQYKGRKVLIPKSAKPTLSKVRESTFNILGSYFIKNEGLIFLDLYSGSGIMSLEAISRGYKTISVDKDKYAIKLIKENFKNVEGEYKIILDNAQSFIEKTTINPDIIYIDPPWEDDYEKTINLCLEKFKNTIIIIEYDKKRAQTFNEFYHKTITPFKEKVYGRCKLDFLKVPF